MSHPLAEDAGRTAGSTEQSWLKAVPTGTGITVLALHLSPPVPAAPALESALREVQRTHPILRARIQPSSSTISISKEPYVLLETLDDAAVFDLLTSASADDEEPNSGSPLRAVLRRELNRNPWAGKSPDPAALFATLCVLGTDGPAPSAVLAVRFHTVAGDRASAITVASELLGMIRDGRPSTGTGGVVLPFLPSVEDLIPPEHGRKPFWARGKDMLGYSLNFTRSSMLPFDDAKSARSTDLVVMELSLDETRKLLDGCERRGIKLFGALTAAGLIATATSKGLPGNKSESYCVITLTDCRRRLSKPLTDQDLGFYHSAVQTTHTVTGSDGLWDLAKRCHASFSDAVAHNKHFTDMGDLNYLMVKSIQAPQLTPSGSMRTAVLSVFDEPLVYDSSELYQGVGVEDYLACSSVHGVGPSVGLFDTVRDGRLSCACLYPSPLHSRKQVRELVEEMKKVLLAGIAAAE